MTTASPLRRPTKPGTLAFLVAVGVAALGVVVAGLGGWEWGVWLVAGALLFCSVSRLLLPDHAAGLLRVRRKYLDVLACGLLGLGIIVVFVSLPPRP